ncbi:MAG: hypothetical protein CEE38_20510 [Planctomycetes bacterium B3_Pla]|nr:MAG: hypothetical protein CEE38_20510 [Planctomycetes bacterium B3_Pla]
MHRLVQLAKNLEVTTLFKKDLTQNLARLLYRKETGQVAALYVSSFAGIALGFVVSIVNTRLLGPQWYGDFKFLVNLFTLGATVTTFGFFSTGSRLLAKCKNEHIRGELVGGLLTIASLISLLLIVVLFVFSFFVDDLFHPGLGKIIRLFSPLLFIFPFKTCLENIMQGSNHIFQLAIFQRASQALYLIGVLTVSYLIPLSLTICLTLQLGFAALVILVMSLSLKPALNRMGPILSQIYTENRIYGFHVYVGVFANVATAMLMGLLVGYFVNTIAVGFYSLALTVTMPLSFIPSAFGTTLFKTFANRTCIPKTAFLAAIVLTACALTAFLLLIDTIVTLVYPPEFSEVIPLAYVMAIGMVLHGFGDFVNRFLGAHGKGKELRNGAFVVGAFLIAGSFTLIPAYGALGAALTKVFAGGMYCAIMCYYYRKTEI